MNENNLQQSIAYPLHQLYFYLTDTCNLRCRHCWIEPRIASTSAKPNGIDTALFEAILDQGKTLGLTTVKLTGGEPLLHPQIRQLLQMIRRKSLRLAMETNGTLCTPELAECLAGCSEVFVSVSLDGVDGATHDWIRGKKGCFDDTQAGIKNLVNKGIKPQLIMTIMRRNRDQMENFVRMSESLGAGSVKFNVLQPTARGELLHQAGESLDIADMIALGKWVDEELSQTTPLALCFHQPPSFRGLRSMFGNTGDGCQSCGILGILGVLADGSYALCGIGATVPELIFGHAAKDRLHEVWLHTPLLKQIRAGLPQRLTGICSRCVMKNICLGSCLAQNYYRNRNLWAPFWYCVEAFRKGLFPETRLRPEILPAAARK